MATTTSLLLQFGNGETPEVFATNCSVNTTREFTIEASPLEFSVPDCDDENAPSWIERVIDTLSAGISGAGTMDPLSYATLRGLMLAGQPFNMRVKLDIPLAAGGGYFTGSYVFTSLGLAKEGKGLVSCSLSISSNGEITWVDAAA